MEEVFGAQPISMEENPIYSRKNHLGITKKEILEKMAEILCDEKLITEVECLNLKRKIEKYGDTL